MPIVDAHPHIYSPDRDTYPTIEEPWEPGEPASAEDLKNMMDAVGVDRAVFIQTSTFYGHDNRYIMDSAKEHAEWACGVVTLDPDDQSHVDLLEDAVANSNIRGMRGTTDSLNRIATPNVYRLWTKAMELGIPVNCMVMDDLERVPEIERVAQDLGDLKIVIDHCFMLNTRHRTEETLQALERLAKLPNIYAKLTSGTHGSYRVYPYPDMHDPLKRVIEAFGPKRCVWGSNFPNALWSKGATYAQNLHLFVKELGLSLPDKADVLGVTAMSLWFPREHGEEERAVREQKLRTEQESISAQQADESPEEEETEEAKSHAAQITQMADLIAAEGVVEGPIVDEVDGVELEAIMDAATELNAVLDNLDLPTTAHKAPAPETAEANEADDDTTPDPVQELSPGDEEEDEQSSAPETLDPTDVTVDVEELFASQNYTPIETGKIGAEEVEDEGIAADVQAQLDKALGTVNEEPKLDVSDLIADAESSGEAAIDMDALLAAQEAEVVELEDTESGDAETDVAALLTAQEPEESADADDASTESYVVADVQAQLDAALSTVAEEEAALEIEEDDVARDIAALVAARKLEASEKSEVGEAEIDASSLPSTEESEEPLAGESDDADVAADVQAQLDAALGLADEQDAVPEAEDGEVTIDVDALLAAQQEAEQPPAEPSEPAEESDAEIDVATLLAAQESEDPAEVATDDSAQDDGAIDVDALLAAHAADAATNNEADARIDVDALLAAQESEETSVETGEPAEQSSSARVDPEFDMASILEAAEELNAALDSRSELEEIEAAPAEVQEQREDPVAGSTEDAVVNVDELLAAQDYTPIETDRIGQDSPAGPAASTTSEEEEFDLDAMIDVANQLNSMLESVEEIATDISDIAANAESAEDADDQSQRPSA